MSRTQRYQCNQSEGKNKIAPTIVDKYCELPFEI